VVRHCTIFLNNNKTEDGTSVITGYFIKSLPLHFAPPNQHQYYYSVLHVTDSLARYYSHTPGVPPFAVPYLDVCLHLLIVPRLRTRAGHRQLLPLSPSHAHAEGDTETEHCKAYPLVDGKPVPHEAEA
jgi:hypothetical protein